MFTRRTSWKLTPNRFTQALERARAEGRRMLDLTASNPTTAGFHYDEKLLGELAQDGALIYRPEAKGSREAREAVAGYYEGRVRITAEIAGQRPAPHVPREQAEIAGQRPAPHVLREQIVLTASTSEAYSFVFRLLCEPGDEVLVAAPSYPLFEVLADLQDVRLVQFPLFYDHGWQLDLHAVEQAATERTRAVLLVHPNNPTGSYVKPAEAERLNEICRARGLALVVDEVFLDFSHGEAKPTFAGNEGALTFTLSGLSKICGLPQMKLAWMVVSGPESEEALRRLEMIADTYLSVSTPVQLAAARFLEWRGDFQRQLMERVLRNLAELDAQLASHARARRLNIEGGWYAVLRVPVTRSDEELAIELLERGVEVHPGHFFDFAAEGNLVISLITPEGEFTEGMGRVLQLV